MQPGPEAKEEAGIKVETPRADWTGEVGASGPRGWAVTSDLWAGRHCSLGRVHAGPSHSHTHADMRTDTCAHTRTYTYTYLKESLEERKKNQLGNSFKSRWNTLLGHNSHRPLPGQGVKSGLRVP